MPVCNRQFGSPLVPYLHPWHVGSYRFGWEDAGSDKERFADYTFHRKAE